MQLHAKSRANQFRWLTVAVSILVLIACTSFVTHVDKAGGDDGKGHCSICLGATSHIVQPAAAVQIAPQIVTAAFTSTSDPLIKQDQFISALGQRDSALFLDSCFATEAVKNRDCYLQPPGISVEQARCVLPDGSVVSDETECRKSLGAARG